MSEPSVGSGVEDDGGGSVYGAPASMTRGVVDCFLLLWPGTIQSYNILSNNGVQYFFRTFMSLDLLRPVIPVSARVQRNKTPENTVFPPPFQDWFRTASDGILMKCSIIKYKISDDYCVR